MDEETGWWVRLVWRLVCVWPPSCIAEKGVGGNWVSGGSQGRALQETPSIRGERADGGEGTKEQGDHPHPSPPRPSLAEG